MRYASTTGRCGKLMIRYEAANGPMFEQPACARPEGHAGMCRSAAALKRKYAADAARTAVARAIEGRWYGRPAELRDRRAAA